MGCKYYFKGDYFYTRDGSKIRVWKGGVLLPPFNQLWFLPWDLQPFRNIFGSSSNGSPVSFTLPSQSLTSLSGQVPPEYGLVSWTMSADTQDGPITSVVGGSRLMTIFTGIDYLVRWKSNVPIEIGFYSEMSFLSNRLYPLVSNDYAVQLGKGKEGSFLAGNYQVMYVAARMLHNNDCNKAGVIPSVDMLVSVSVPCVSSAPVPGATELLEIEGREYPVYKNTIDGNEVVTPKLNPKFQSFYERVVADYESHSIPLPIAVPTSVTPSRSLSNPRTYYNGKYDRQGAQYFFVPYSNTTDLIDLRRGQILDPNNGNPYVGVNVEGVDAEVAVDYDITLNDVPGLRRNGILGGIKVQVVVQTFDNPSTAGWPRGVAGSDFTLWDQGNKSVSLKGTLIAPQALSNVVVSVNNQGGVFSLSSSSPSYGNMCVFNSLVVRPVA